MDESTDLSSTSQLLVFIRGAKFDFLNDIIFVIRQQRNKKKIHFHGSAENIARL